MKASNVIFLSFTLILIMVLLYGMNKCQEGNPSENDTVILIDTEIVIDTFYSLETLTVSKPGDIVYIDIPGEIDTQAILKDYYAQKTYVDTLRNDTNLFLRLEEVISENKIVNRVLEIKDFEQTNYITTTKIIEKPQKGLYAGVSLGTEMSTMFVGGRLSYVAKKSVFGISFGTNKTLYVDYVFKLKK